MEERDERSPDPSQIVNSLLDSHTWVRQVRRSLPLFVCLFYFILFFFLVFNIAIILDDNLIDSQFFSFFFCVEQLYDEFRLLLKKADSSRADAET